MQRIVLHAIAITLYMFFVSCNSSVDSALDLAEGNRKELEKVLNHFQNDPDPLKYEAAKFLIANMPYHGSFIGLPAEQYDSAYLVMSKYPVQFRDSIFKLNAKNISLSSATYVYDINNISADYLIKAIDDACRVWNNSTWHTTYDKSIFFDYVLPYRILNERVSDWRTAVCAEFPSLAKEEIVSKRGVNFEAETASIEDAAYVFTESASEGKMVLIEKPESKAIFTINSPMPSTKRVFLRYTATCDSPRIKIIFNGHEVSNLSLDPTKSLREFRDSRGGIDLMFEAGNNTLAIAYDNGVIGLDRITLSSVESFGKNEATDFSQSLYRIKNRKSNNYITFDTLSSSLLKDIRLCPKSIGDSCSMLRLVYRGIGCWSISSFRKDSADLCAEVQYCRTEENAPICQYHYLNGNHQKWVFLPCGNGAYKIMSKDSGLFLESVCDSMDGNERMALSAFADRSSQKWELEKCGINMVADDSYPYGSAVAEAMRVYDVSNQFEWFAFSCCSTKSRH